MRRWLSISAILLAVTGMTILTAASSTRATESAASVKRNAQEAHSITITPWGPDQQMVDAAKGKLLSDPAVTKYLNGARHRLLTFEYVDQEKVPGRFAPPEEYRATLFDYSKNRAIQVKGRFDGAGPLEVTEAAHQPLPDGEEFAEAVDIVTQDSKIGPAIRNGKLVPYEPMPALADIDLPPSRVERTVTVGLMPVDGGEGHEIVGVNMIKRSISHYAAGAPASATVNSHSCGIPSAGQSTTSQGTAGQWEMVISRGGTEIWRMLVIRPSASSGRNASGIELRNVRYLGKLVLARAHEPVLNVSYDRNACGPFRDWSWQEGMFQAQGTDVAPGIRLCTTKPTTSIDTGNDSGNFRGVAVYDKEEVALISELNAGWYRYISEWYFTDDGKIRPRFGFGATTNGCVCAAHNHHVYWRFDFDVITAAENSVFELGEGNPRLIEKEVMQLRQGGHEQKWLIMNNNSGEGVVIEPGHHDGNVNKYGRGDLWFLLNKSNEIDDVAGGGSAINIGSYVNNETISRSDLVVWYAGHWNHDHNDTNSKHHGGPARVGPDLVVQKY
ncbi:MAG TPA: hypothetical protein VE262_14940 [Blastocatellia bacterium]|nr:hypothetical protein [Blastocatellia bacterium]